MKKTQTQERAVTKRLEAQLQESKKTIYTLTYFDATTTLPNRKKLVNLFNQQIEKGALEEGAIFLIDIDRFHSINGVYGRQSGDQLLKEIAQRLGKVTKKDERVFTNGEDEFIVYIEELPCERMEVVGQEILDVLSKHFTIEDKTFYLTASIGMSHYPTTGQTIEDVLEQAEIAMYKVKRAGKNNLLTFLPKDAEDIARRSRIEIDLQKALNENQLYLDYQPKINLETKELFAVEALIRWKHPELGTISPGEFIPIAEESGIIKDIGYWVIYEALRQTKEWEEAGYNVRTAVNVSVIQFKDRHFVKRVLDILKTIELDPWHLIVEITESVVRNVRYAAKNISELRENNIRIAIDDFGTGYSSLSVLKDTSVDVVKIDKSFIDNIPADSVSSNLVSTMIQMGEDMNFDIIAEGIETPEQSNYLIENNCKFGQGYLYSRPVSPDKITAYIDQFTA